MNESALESFLHANNTLEQEQVIMQHPELLDLHVVEKLHQRQLAYEAEGNFKEADIVAFGKELITRCIEIGAEEALAEARRGTLKDILKAFIDRFKPRFHPVWNDSPFPEIFQTVQNLAKENGFDGAQLDNYGEAFFSSARQAHKANRQRVTLHNLYWAFAFFLCSKNLERIVASLNNLAVALRETSQYEKALFLQDFSLRLKREIGASSESIGRAHAEIGEIYYRMGNYRLAMQHMLKTQAIVPYYENIDQRVEFMFTRAKLSDELIEAEATIEDIDVTKEQLQRHADDLKQAGNFREAAMTYAKTASLAHICKDLNTELCARLELAEITYQDMGIYQYSSTQYTMALHIAEKLKNQKSRFEALIGIGLVAGEMGKLDESQDSLEMALTLVGNSLPQERTSMLHAQLSLSFLMGSRQDEGEKHLQAALAAIREFENIEDAINTLIRIGILFRNQDLFDAALDCFQMAVELHFQLPLLEITHSDLHRRATAISANVFEQIADIQWAQKDPRAAADALNVADGYAKLSQDKILIARLSAKLANCYSELGLGDQAQEAAQVAQAYLEEIDDPSLSHFIWYSIINSGMVATRPLLEQADAKQLEEEQRGFYGAGFDAYIEWLRARVLQAEMREDKSSLASLHLEIATLLSSVNRTYEARLHFVNAFRHARQQGQLELLGKIFQNYGVLMAINNRAFSARNSFRIALAYKDRYADGADRENSLVCLAQANAIMGDDTEAVRLADEAEHMLASHTGKDEASLLVSLAQIDRDLRRPDAGIAKLKKALAILKREGSWKDFIFALICISDLYRAKEDIHLARRYAKYALAVLESQRLHTPPKYRSSMQGIRDKVIDSLLQTLYQSNQLNFKHALQALSELEKARWRSLIEGLGEEALSPPADFPPELKSKEAELLSSLASREQQALDPAIIAEQDPVLLNGVRRSAEEARQAVYQFWKSLPDQWKSYGKLRLGKPIDLTWLLQSNYNLRNAHILVLYPVRDLTYVWKILPGCRIIGWETLPITRKDVTRLCRSLQSAFENRQNVLEEYKEMCKHLAPCIEAFPVGATICIVPGGSFVGFPFASLQSSGKYWIERNPLVLLPSLSVMSYLSTNKTPKSRTTALVLGDSLGNLPYGRKEAKDVAKLLRTIPYVGEDVSRSLVRVALPSVDLLHVACHAYYNSRDPASSGFILADQTVCSARDLRQMALNARLAVLSACESGIQYVNEGEENIGLVASLLHAGLPSIVATLWEISDKTTLDLMKRFYRELQQNGGNAAEALRTAQCEFLHKRSLSDPYYWAAFQLHGRWEDILI